MVETLTCCSLFWREAPSCLKINTNANMKVDTSDFISIASMRHNMNIIM